MSAFDDAERRRMSIVLRRLRKAYPEAGIALHFGSAWELLVAMLVMEAAFGLPGLIAAPIFYAYLKTELKTVGWI